MTTRQFYVLLFVLVMSQVVGFGLLLHRLPPPGNKGTQPMAAVEQQSQDFPSAKPASTGQDMSRIVNQLQSAAMRNTIEGVLRDALANVLRQQGQSTPPQQAVEQTPTSEQQATAEQAMAVIDNAISAGVWTQEDNTNLIPYAVKLTHEQRVELINHFVQAVQNKQIILKGPPPAL